jgi:hypothetical protein
LIPLDHIIADIINIQSSEQFDVPKVNILFSWIVLFSRISLSLYKYCKTKTYLNAFFPSKFAVRIDGKVGRRLRKVIRT